MDRHEVIIERGIFGFTEGHKKVLKQLVIKVDQEIGRTNVKKPLCRLFDDVAETDHERWVAKRFVSQAFPSRTRFYWMHEEIYNYSSNLNKIMDAIPIDIWYKPRREFIKSMLKYDI